MIEFRYNGIEIEVYNRPEAQEYEVAENKTRIRHSRNAFVFVKFWDFVIKDGNLYELAFVKSVCSFFMQAYWKRSTKDGNRINLSETLKHEIAGGKYASCVLNFNARQKDKIIYLHICQKNDEEVAGEIYLTGREVIMLDIAVGKAINMLTPTNEHQP